MKCVLLSRIGPDSMVHVARRRTQESISLVILSWRTSHITGEASLPSPLYQVSKMIWGLVEYALFNLTRRCPWKRGTARDVTPRSAKTSSSVPSVTPRVTDGDTRHVHARRCGKGRAWRRSRIWRSSSEMESSPPSRAHKPSPLVVTTRVLSSF